MSEHSCNDRKLERGEEVFCFKAPGHALGPSADYAHEGIFYLRGEYQGTVVWMDGSGDKLPGK